MICNRHVWGCCNACVCELTNRLLDNNYLSGTLNPSWADPQAWNALQTLSMSYNRLSGEQHDFSPSCQCSICALRGFQKPVLHFASCWRLLLFSRWKLVKVLSAKVLCGRISDLMKLAAQSLVAHLHMWAELCSTSGCCTFVQICQNSQQKAACQPLSCNNFH